MLLLPAGQVLDLAALMPDGFSQGLVGPCPSETQVMPKNKLSRKKPTSKKKHSAPFRFFVHCVAVACTLTNAHSTRSRALNAIAVWFVQAPCKAFSTSLTLWDL